MNSPRLLLRLMGLSDSALPVGGFTFSVGIETAVGEGLIEGEEELEEYLRSICRATASLEGVAALGAFRAAREGDFEGAAEVDRLLHACRSGEENRLMSLRMGAKLAELGAELFSEEPLVARWLAAIRHDELYGEHATTLGLLFAAGGLSEQGLFTSLLYGVASQLLSASLRTMRISHHTTWRLLFSLGEEVERLYNRFAPLGPEEMHRFSPQTEILAALHEWGERRLFMN